MRLALAYAAAGDVGRTMEAGTLALDAAGPVASAAVRHQASALAAVVRRWPSSRNTRDFRIRLDRELRPPRPIA
jgi:hypothetical protein